MRADQLKLVEESYARCCESPGFLDTFYKHLFLDTFYQHLLESSPAIPPMFSQTDFERQHKVLQHGLGILLIYAKRKNPALLQRIAGGHGRKDVNVDPSLYAFFVESLVTAVREHDSKASPDIEDAWRAATALRMPRS